MITSSSGTCFCCLQSLLSESHINLIWFKQSQSHLGATYPNLCTQALHKLLVANAGELGQSLYASLLAEPVLQVVNYQINSAVHRSKVRIWQALAVLSAFIPGGHVQHALAQLWPLLQVSPPANNTSAYFQHPRCSYLLVNS